MTNGNQNQVENGNAVRSLEDLEAKVRADLAVAADAQARAARLLDEVLRLARGTGDVRVEAATAVAQVEAAAMTPLEDVTTRVERVLHTGPATTDELSYALGEPVDWVLAALRPLVTAGKARADGKHWRRVEPAPAPAPAPTRPIAKIAVRQKPRPAELAAAIEHLLRTGPHSMLELTEATGAPVARVQEIVRAMRAAGKIHNAGTEDRPRWHWIVGDAVPTAELYAAVERLIRERPMTTAELVEATGSRPQRIGGAIVKFQTEKDESGKLVYNLVNLGTTRNRGRWFMLPNGARRNVRGPTSRKK